VFVQSGLLLVTLFGALFTFSAQQSTPPDCHAVGQTVQIPELPEASGLALGRRTPDRVWSHNDSGKTGLIALTSKGAVTARVEVSGLSVEDWEAIAVGPCPSGSCIYIADIGDNQAERKRITVHRLQEPSNERSVQIVDTFHATYPDGPHDAETLLVAPEGLFIVTKGDTGPVGLYRFPDDRQQGGTYQLSRIGELRNVTEEDWITDGTLSPDGRWVVLRTHFTLRFYPAANFLAGQWLEAARVDLKDLNETQGEGVAMESNGTIYLTGEGGGESRPGSFATVACSPVLNHVSATGGPAANPP
jgi:hypothetical protein